MTQPTRPSSPAAGRRRGFTLVEVLVAIGIILLLMALALPAFRAITGSRSVEGATNQVTAMLSRARSDAITAAVPHGVAFFVDAAGQARMAEVAPVSFAAWGGSQSPYALGTYVYYQATPTSVVHYYVCVKPVPAASTIDITNASYANSTDPVPAGTYWHEFASGTAAYWWATTWVSASSQLYDQVPQTDAIPLPLGVGAQVIADSAANTAVPERYLRDGLVVFDGSGRLTYQSTACSKFGLVGAQAGLDLASVLYNPTSAQSSSTPGQATQMLLPSSFGLVLYERDAYASQNFPPADPTLNAAYSYAPANGTNTEGDAEAWLDTYATPLLINRYTGSLVRGE